jgi:hypothetical protein
MCLFLPTLVYYNNITSNNIIPCRPAIPRRRLLAFTLSSFHHNNIYLVSKKTATGLNLYPLNPPPPNLYTDIKDEVGFNSHFTDNNTV